MVPALILGAFAGLALSRFALHRRHRWAHAGGCGAHGAGFADAGFGAERTRCGGGLGRRRFDAVQLLDELGLDDAQRDAARTILRELRRVRGSGRLARIGLVADAFGDQELDRPKLESIIGQGVRPLTRSGELVVDALEKLHAILTPEQRGRLRSFLTLQARSAGSSGDPLRL